jgi:hypothetical protein
LVQHSRGLGQALAVTCRKTLRTKSQAVDKLPRCVIAIGTQERIDLDGQAIDVLCRDFGRNQNARRFPRLQLQHPAAHGVSLNFAT